MQSVVDGNDIQQLTVKLHINLGEYYRLDNLLLLVIAHVNFRFFMFNVRLSGWHPIGHREAVCSMGRSVTWLNLGKDDDSWLEKENLYHVNSFFLIRNIRNSMMDFSNVLQNIQRNDHYFPFDVVTKLLLLSLPSVKPSLHSQNNLSWSQDNLSAFRLDQEYFIFKLFHSVIYS